MKNLSVLTVLACLLVAGCGGSSEPTGFNNPKTLQRSIDGNTEGGFEKKETQCVAEGSHKFQCLLKARRIGSEEEWETTTVYVTVAANGESWVSH
jgi:hypothetical protein